MTFLSKKKKKKFSREKKKNYKKKIKIKKKKKVKKYKKKKRDLINITQMHCIQVIHYKKTKNIYSFFFHL